MARQNIVPNPSQRLFEAYMDFSGGLNSETSNEKLKDNEFPIMENVDLSGRGSAKRRTGRTLLGSASGTAQGLFFYYRQGQDLPDVMMAISGSIYVKRASDTQTFEYLQDLTWNSIGNKTWEDLSANAVLEKIELTDAGTPFSFQDTLPVEAVQYGDDLFVATGTKLVEITYDLSTDKWTGKTVEAHTPTIMEAIYIGTNALADNPDAYVVDGTGTLEVVGIKPEKRTGAVNQSLNMTAYINTPSAITVEYKWEYKRSSETAWTLGSDFSSSNKSYGFSVDIADAWDIRVTIRQSGTTTPTPFYTLSDFMVNQVEDKSNTDLPVTGIQKCRKILLHWDRILLTGDDTNPYQMYISDLDSPRYFPVTNTIKFDTGKLEPITSVVRFQDMLVVFTKTTIQTLTGKSTDDYARYIIHDGIGCIADRTAKVVGNNVVFLSHEGLMMLKPNYFKLESMNVSRIDYPIKSEVTADTDACALTWDSQYWICLPQKSVVYRLYYDNGMWVKDTSSKLNISQFLQYGNDVYNLTSDGNLYKHDQTIYNDVGEVYSMKVESKYYDLSASFNYKKLKNLYVLGRHYSDSVALSVTVLADSATVLSSHSGWAVVNQGYVEWEDTDTPNMNFNAGIAFGSWVLGQSLLGNVTVSVQKASVRGKCRRVKLTFEHAQDNPCEIYGFGLEFRMKNV